MKKALYKALIPTVLISLPAISGAAVDLAYKPANLDCVLAAAARQNVPANVLLGLSSIEMGKNGQAVRNRNGSYDLGHFQINTIHFGKNGIFTQMGIHPDDAKWRGCYNAELAAYLLRLNLNEENGQDFWTKAANYHSKSPAANRKYRQKLIPLARQWAVFLTVRYRNVTVVTL